MEEGQRTVYVNIRMTEAETASLRRMMTLEGYTSRSRFIRDHLFSRPVRRRVVTLTSSDLAREMLETATQLRKIGINVNQITRWFNSTMKSRSRSRDGPVMSQRDLTYLSTSLTSLFEEAVATLEKVRQSSESLLRSRESTSETTVQQTSDNTAMQTITITGNLTSDAEVRQAKDSERMSFKVAVNDKGGETETTTFYSCSMKRTGVLEHLRKGKRVLVSGDFHQNTVEKDGRTFVNNNVFVSKLELLSSLEKPEDLPQ